MRSRLRSLARAVAAGGRGRTADAARGDVDARYQLVTRAGCHLCDDMARLLDDTLPRRGLLWEAVDVDRDAALRERFGEVVPVLLRDGVPVAKVRIEAKTLERILDRRR